MEMRHEVARQRFVAELPEGDVVVEYVERPDGVLDFRHTFTPPALRGRGLAGALVLFAFEHARVNGVKIVPTCRFVKRMLREHPEYVDVAAAGQWLDVG